MSAEIIKSQKDVFDTLKIEIIQQHLDKKDHGEWMTGILQASKDEDIVFFCDIDAFPMKSSAFAKALEIVDDNKIFGLAQHSNRASSSEIYAGPMFLGVKRKLWAQLGIPSLKADARVDAGEILTLKARQAGIPVEMIYPTVCIKPKWGLGDAGVFGIGTFYGNLDFFHLFESRLRTSTELMAAVAHDIKASLPLNFGKYMSLVNKGGLCSKIEEFSSKLSRKLRQMA